MASSAQPAPGQTAEALAEEVAAQNTLVNELRKQGADSAAQEEAKKRLGELKKNLALLQHAAGAGGKGEKKKERMLLKTAKVRGWPVCCGWGSSSSQGSCRLYSPSPSRPADGDGDGDGCCC